MSVADLRVYARANQDQHSLTGVQIVGMRKADLINSLLGEQQGAITNPEIDLAEVLAYALNGKVQGQVNMDQVKTLVDSSIRESEDMLVDLFETMIDKIDTVKTVEVKSLTTGETKDIGVAHCQFERVLTCVANRVNVYMCGTAGSGKTYLAEQVAEALDLPFYAISVGLQTSKSDLIGYNSANGEYVSTLLRQAYEFGGVFLIDEIDAGNPNVLTVINAMTANSVASFPDRMVKKHDDFVLLASANTYGRGADRQYVGRNPIDGATLDRFFVIDIDIDETLEMRLAPDKDWCKRVQAIRSAIHDLKEKVICSPRASITGGKMALAGVSYDDLEDAFIFRGINPEIKDKILRRVS